MDYFGARLRALRKRKGWTQKQLATYIHRSAAAVGSYEQNTQIPPIDVLISLTTIFRVSLEELLGITQDIPRPEDQLSQKQRKAVDMLLQEFLEPTSNGEGLSDAQMQIINTLICLFVSPE